MSWEARVNDALQRFEQVTAALADPQVLADRQRYRDAAREHAELTGTGRDGRSAWQGCASGWRTLVR